jgi:CheY-like chemotaxis protein
VSESIERLRILIVEDDEDTAELLAETFQDRGHSVEICREGGAALVALPRFMPHVALLDVGLPDMSGYELAQRMRALPASAVAVRLIALTGYGGEEERARAHQAGFSAHFLKPVHPDVLVRAVENPHDPKGIANVAQAQTQAQVKDAHDREMLAREKRS